MLEKLVESRKTLYAIIIAYLLVSTILAWIAETNFWTTFRQNLDLLTLVFALLSLFWIYDTRQAVRNYGQKNKILGIINLLNRALTTDAALGSDLMKEALAEILSVKPSKVLKHVKPESNSNSESMDITDLESYVCNEIYRFSMGEFKDKPLSSEKHFHLMLYLLKSRLENNLMEFKVEDGS